MEKVVKGSVRGRRGREGVCEGKQGSRRVCEGKGRGASGKEGNDGDERRQMR